MATLKNSVIKDQARILKPYLDRIRSRGFSKLPKLLTNDDVILAVQQAIDDRVDCHRISSDRSCGIVLDEYYKRLQDTRPQSTWIPPVQTIYKQPKEGWTVWCTEFFVNELSQDTLRGWSARDAAKSNTFHIWFKDFVESQIKLGLGGLLTTATRQVMQHTDWDAVVTALKKTPNI